MAEYPLDAAPAQAPMRRAGVLALLSAAALGLATAPGLAAGGPIGVLQAMPASLQGVVDTIPLASHRAVYDLSLLKAVGTKSPTGARGRIAFDFSGSTCDGYVQNFRQLTELQPAEGPTRISDMHSATFEDGNGKSFAFKMETTVDDDPTDQVDGRAERKGRGGVDVNLVKPKTEQLALGRDILFPTEHIKYILAAAEAAENTLEVRVYDGSDSGDKIYDTTTFIGRPIDTPAAESALQIPELEHMRRWPVTISYFDDGRKDEAPNYTLSFDLYENGISRALRLNYGDFVLAGEMTSLKLLPTPPCGK
ncbi:MAG: cell envelope integrity EipB family protein [Methylovirgula sp.]